MLKPLLADEPEIEGSAFAGDSGDLRSDLKTTTLPGCLQWAGFELEAATANRSRPNSEAIDEDPLCRS